MPKIKFILHREQIKTLVIILLLISAVALAGQSGYYSAISEKLSSAQTASASAAVSASAAEEGFAAYNPLSMSINVEAGAHHGVQYSAAALESAYARFSVALGEALGSAHEVVTVDERQWQNALNGPGVYFSFPCEIPVAILASFLGAEAGEEIENISASRFVISCGSDEVRLLFWGEDGAFYMCKTDVSLSAILSNIALYEENGATFAYKLPEAEGLAPYTLIPEALGAVQKLVAQPSFSEDFDYSGIFAAFGINTKVMTGYTEADGAQVFVEGDKNLRILPDGTVVFGSAAPVGAATAQDDVANAVSLALSLAGSTIGVSSGAAAAMLSDISYDKASGRCTVTFQYVAEGISVSLYGPSAAAEIVIGGGEVLSAELRALRFSLGEEERSLLPVSSAVAIMSAAASAASKNGSLCLVYAQDAAGAIACVWMVD